MPSCPLRTRSRAVGRRCHARRHEGRVKVLGFVLEKKKSVPTELDEFCENSDEFQTQFGEFSECET
jgi:hypothetical protein